MDERVRLLEVHDDSEWLRMRDALWPGLPAADHEREMADYRDRATTAVFVVDRGDGRLGGFLEAATREGADGCETSPVGYIEGWYVDADLRRQGLGARSWPRQRPGPVRAAMRRWPAIAWSTTPSASWPDSSLGYREVERLIHFRKPLSGTA